MIVLNAKRARSTARPLISGPGLTGLLIGLLAALSAVQAASPTTGGVFTPAFIAQVAPVNAAAPAVSADPAKQLPGAISVSKIDFKRGNDGAGRLIISFSGDGASPDLRNQGSSLLVNVGNAQLPAELQKQLNVSDFATPVQRIDARATASGTQLVLNTAGAFETMAYQVGRDYVVEILPRKAGASDRAVGATGVTAATTAQAAVATTRYAGRPVTFNFQDVPVRTVLQLIAEESSLNIVASDTVTGNVTLRLVNVPWDQALDIVLQAKGLDKRRSGNVVWVAPQVEIAKYEQDREDARIALDNRIDLATEYVQINYHNAAQIYKALTEAKGVGGSGGGGAGGGGGGGGGGLDSGFLSSRGRLVADERTNTLMISDIPKKIAQMKELIRVIDRPVDQVVIEARVVVANENFKRELGAKFGLHGATGSPGDRSSLGFGGSTDSSSTNAIERANRVAAGKGGFEFNRTLGVNLPVANAAGAIAMSILNAGYLLDVELSALQAEGRGEVISNPRVVTSNQREAVITQGREIGYVTIQPATAGGVPTPSVQFKEVVLEMRVTPTITNDGRVFLNLNVKKDELERYIDTSIGQVPQIGKRQVNTAVLVEDGQTVVIGGVYEFANIDDVTKVPFLGDIPFLGNLFKKKNKENRKAELLIFVTPKVLRVEQR